jgi:hypothetical protein
MLASTHCLWLALFVMAREFKPVRFFVMMALATFVVCGVTAFYTHRAAHGRTAEERSAYAIGLKAGEQAPADAILPTDAELNMMAQNYFEQQGSGDQLGTSSRAAEQQAWDLAFENGYTDGFKKTHGR